MKLRMYLRGLGIGIIVTAVLMGLTTAKVNKISDSEIIKRAEALGMVKEDNSINSVVSEPKEEIKEEKPKEEPPKEEEKPKEDTPKEEEPPKAEEPKTEEPKTEEPKTEESKEDKAADTAVVTSGNFTLEVAGGSGSETVSALLEKGGVIKSATDFDDFLCKNGYDHRITPGKHVIPAGSDYETIAKIITSR